MTSAPPTPGGEPPLPGPVHCARPAGFSRQTTCIDPDVALPSNGADQAGALVIVAEGTVEVACERRADGHLPRTSSSSSTVSES